MSGRLESLPHKMLFQLHHDEYTSLWLTMTMRKTFFFVLIAVIALAGCGGGGNPVQPPDYDTDIPQSQEDYWIRTADDFGLHLILHRPADSSPSKRYPGLILIPGALQAGDVWHSRNRKSNAWEFVDEGMIVLLYDARGRGYSGGTEDYDGPIQQDDLKIVIEWLNKRPNVLPGGVGIGTSSWGITVAAGTLGRYPDVPVKFLVDLEGAHDRYVMTQWDDPKWVKILHGHGTWDEEFWKDREAIKYIGDITCPYYRIQSSYDHALDRFYVDHAIAMVDAAVEGKSPFVQLNDMEPNQLYDVENADKYHWYKISQVDLMFFDTILRAMGLPTE